jgi:hypothetical protein
MNREQRFSQHDWRMPNRRELRSMLSPKNTATVVGQKRFAQFSVLVVATVD